MLMEVEHPDAPTAGKADPLARVRLFCRLGEAHSVPIRVLDIDYVQPKLSLATPGVSEKPMWLLYAFRRPTGSLGEVRREFVASLLSFVYRDVYPDGYSDDQSEQRRYENYCGRLCARKIAALPKEIRALEYKGVKAKFLHPRADGIRGGKSNNAVLRRDPR